MAQIAQESIKITPELPGKRDLDPCRKWVLFRARNLSPGT